MSAQVAFSGRGDASAPRRYELDWLRTLVVLGIIPLHALVIFGASSTTFIKSTVSVPILAVVWAFVLTWGIPLIFLMAGAAARLALEHRTAGAYIRERLSRLLVPMVLVALVLSPLSIYFVLLGNPALVSISPVPIQNPGGLSDFGTFYRTYLAIIAATVRDFNPGLGALVLAHLWFIPRLLIVSLLALPLVLAVQHYGDRLKGLAAYIDQHPAALLFGGGLAAALVAALIRPGWLDRLTTRWQITGVWWETFLDFALFLCGYLIYSRPRLIAGVRNLRGFTLGAGLACTAAIGIVTFFGKSPSSTSFAPAALAYSVALALSAWLVSLGFLGIALRYLAFSTPLQRYLTEAAFPVFVLHLPILTITAFFLLRWPVPWYVQYVLITGVTMLVALGIFDLVIRRTPVTRFLLGVKRTVPAHHKPEATFSAPPHEVKAGD